jgi:predicted nucleotidyltransferase
MKARRDKAGDPIVAEIVDRLVATYRPERVYLFGSKARGDAGPDSDYDFLLVVPDDTPAELLRGGPGYQALWGLKTAADVLVVTRERFESRLCLKSSLSSTVLREGKLLYAA